MGKVILSGGAPSSSIGTSISKLAVGSIVKMNVNGSAKEFIVVH